MHKIKRGCLYLNMLYGMKAAASGLSPNLRPFHFHLKACAVGLDFTQRAENAFASLPLQQAEAIRLLYVEKIGFDDAARGLGVSRLQLAKLSFMGVSSFVEAFEKQQNRRNGISC